MHGKPKKSFSEKFKSKNAAKAASDPKPPKSAAGRPRTKRMMGAPLEFWTDVCRLTKGRATLVVAMCTSYRRVQICGSQR